MQAGCLTPKNPTRSDRFLNPYTRRIVHYTLRRRRQLEEHCLWLPTAEGVREYLPIEIEQVSGLTIAQVGRWLGAGPGESEAILSLFHFLRTELRLTIPRGGAGGPPE